MLDLHIFLYLATFNTPLTLYNLLYISLLVIGWFICWFSILNKSISDLVGDKKFDVILMYSVIGHNPIREVYKIFSELKKHLKDNGKIFFDYQSSHENNPNDYFTSFLGFTIKRSVKDFRFTAKEISQLMEDIGYQYQELKEFETFQDSITSNHFKKFVMVEHKKSK